MTTHKKMFARRAIAGLGVASLGVGGFAAAASAAVGPDQLGHPESGSLTIHKLDAPQGSAGNGSELENPGGEPLGGVKFTIWQLGTLDEEDNCVALDLRDTDDWAGLEDLGVAPGTLAGVQAAGFCVAPAGAPVLDPNPTVGTTRLDEAGFGTLTFGNLDLGLYYVQETDASGAVTWDSDEGKPVPAKVVSESAPFYVTIPLANDGDWIYNVHAYPKNQTLNEPSKEINEDDEQEGLVIGSTVEWTITQDVPRLNAGEEYTSASIYEVLDPEWLAFDATVSVKHNGADVTDYTVDEDKVGGFDRVTWVFGEEVLEELEAGDTLEVVFTTTVLKVSENGEIENPGSDGSKPGYGGEFNGTKIPGGPTPATYWGALEVEKVDQDGNPLAGALFEVYPANVNEEGVALCPADIDDIEGDLVSTGTSTTANNGLVLWTPNRPTNNTSPLGLFVHNTNDETENPADFEKTYCMYETVVPAGYTGVGVQTVVAKPGTTNTVQYTGDDAISNTQKTPPTLPQTGSNGTVIMSIAGLALIGVGAGTVLVARNRRRSDAA